jgi:hypothetical protein
MSDSHEVNIHVQGTEEAAHGVGTFFLFAIPGVLATALVIGLGFVTGIIELKQTEKQYQREETTQDRMDGRVGVAEPLKSPIKLVILPKHGCVQIEQAFLDGTRITVYIRSHCSVFMDYYKLHIAERSPDGTVVASDYENTSSLPQISPGDRVEWSHGLSGDDRVTTVQVWTNDHQ